MHCTCRLVHVGEPVRRDFEKGPPNGFYQTDWYNKSGSPTFSISGMVHFRSNALDRTILKICDWSVSSYWLGINGTHLLHIDTVTGTGENQGSPHGLGKSSCLYTS